MSEYNDISDILDDMTNLEYNEAEQAKLESKFKPRTQVDINAPFYKASGLVINLSQLLSIVLGFGVCLYMADKFPKIAPIIFGSCLFGLILIEIGKRKALGKIDEIRVINRKKSIKLKSTPYQIASVLLVAASLGSGFIGGPEIIERFSQHEPLKMIDEIKADFHQLIESNKSLYTSQKTEAFAMANTLHNQSNWKGTTSRDVREQKADLIVLGASKDSTMNRVINDLTSEMNYAVLGAEDFNHEMITEHKDWCYKFAWWAIGIVLFLDVVLVVLSRWRYDHEDRKRKENNNKKELLKEGTKDYVKQAVKDEDTDKDLSLTDGEIKPSSGGQTNIITIKHTDGTLKSYTSGKFRSYFNSSGEGRQQDLQHYMDDLAAFENTKQN